MTYPPPLLPNETDTDTIRLQQPESPRPFSVEVQDDESVRRIALRDGSTVFGSSRKADWTVADAAVSAQHCSLEIFGAGVRVVDLGSTNGTFVGSARVNEAWCGPGTTITIGRSSLIVRDHVQARDGELDEPPLPGIAGGSIAMRKLAARVRRLAKYTSPVLVAGETGSGKELVARALHTESPRAGGPFVALNVSALPRELVESELFGHERGAFTGAVTRRKGAFADAEGGTLFLDEIGELPMDAQPKLLRALDGYELRRVGEGGGGFRANARVVAATHVPLEAAVLARTFRRDLFHRLEVWVVDVPPLRERRGDIATIAKHLLASERELELRTLASSALARLVAHDWPGNVRELRNVLVRAADGARGKSIDGMDIDRAMRRPSSMPPLELGERGVRELLVEYGGNVSAAARAAGVPRTTFRKKISRD